MKTINIPPLVGTPLFLSAVIIVLAIWLAPRSSRNGKRVRNWSIGFYVAFWATLVGSAAAVWMVTILHQTGGAWRALGFSIAAATILVATFVLEGVEAAVSELRDKDELQLSAPIRSIFRRLSKEEDAFFETREWLVVALVVIATLMMESDHYFIPVVTFCHGSLITAPIDIKGEEPLGRFIRIALSLILSTFPFVWLAQGPGKHVARRNSVQFLRYSGIQFSIQIVEAAWRIMRILGLQYPSRIANETALLLLKRCQKTRYLPPSEFSFFSDSLKRYGYGSPITDLKIMVHDDGSLEVDSKFLAYLVTPRSGVSRIFTFENGYVAGTRGRLISRNSPDMSWWAFEVPMIGERITPSQLKAWEELLYSVEPSKWQSEGSNELDSRFFAPEVKISDPSDRPAPGTRPVSTLTVTLDFRGDLPQRAKTGRAVLLLWSVRLKTNRETFILPKAWGDCSEYPYDVKYTHPCLRSTTTFSFQEASQSDRQPDYIFVESRSDEHFQVIYGNVVHERESERFRQQRRSDLASAQPRLAPPGHSFTFVLDSVLPSAVYKTRPWVQKPYPPEWKDAEESSS